jgi:hypothetical protein
MGIRRRSSTIHYIGSTSFCIYAATAMAGTGTDDCRTMANDVQRLGCYDQLFPRPVSDSAAASAPKAKPTPPTPTALPAPASSAMQEHSEVSAAADQFGLTAAQRRMAAGGGERPPTLNSISARVTNLQRRASGEIVVFLDNGQVWRQSEPDWWSPPQKGDPVTIRRGSLGSFMLVTADHLATQVRRER